MTIVVLCVDTNGSAELEQIATRLLRSLDRSLEMGGPHVQVTGSVGVSFAAADDVVTAAELMRRADIALYHSKRVDGIRLSMFDHTLEAQARRRVELDNELRGAIARGELHLEYQPIIDLRTGRVSHFEALMRWTNRYFGTVPPDEFIPIAEEFSVINPIGEWALHTACAQLAEWRRTLPHVDVNVAVNVSARQLSDRAFPLQVEQIIRRHGISASSLTIEITETAVMDDIEVSQLVLADLRGPRSNTRRSYCSDASSVKDSCGVARSVRTPSSRCTALRRPRSIPHVETSWYTSDDLVQRVDRASLNWFIP